MSPLFASAQPPAGHEGSAAMPAEIICGCALCEMEPRLLASLAVADERLSTFTESSLLLAYPSIADLVRDLRAAPAHAESDALLGEIRKGRAARPMFIDSLLVLVFVPMLHRTVRHPDVALGAEGNI